MNDFFSRLAKRARGEAIVIEPRMPSLFGPVESDGPVTPAGPETIPVTELRTDRQEAQSHQMPPAAVPKQTAPADWNQPSDNTPDHTYPGQDPPVGNRQGGEAMSIDILQTTGDRETGEGAPQRNIAARQLQPHAVRTIVSLDSTAPVEGEETLVPSPSPVDHIPAATLQQRPLVPDFSPLLPPSPSPVAELPAAQEQVVQREPALHIHIGRIEVRARTTGSASPPEPRKPARTEAKNRFTLNDYLKRSGGTS